MKSDWYTKCVLTIIAISSTVIAVIATIAVFVTWVYFELSKVENIRPKFSSSGALIVTVCNPQLKSGGILCADPEKLEHK
jgi:hypothetical protein